MRNRLALLPLVLVVLLLTGSDSYANLRRGTIFSGKTKAFELITETNGFSTFALIYDRFETDLDLAVGLPDGTLIAASISQQPHLELLQTGLVALQRYIIVVDSFEGPDTVFRLVVNSSQQDTIAVPGLQQSRIRLREIELDEGARKIASQLKTIAAKSKR